VCSIYHASIKSATNHKKECHRKPAQPTASIGLPHEKSGEEKARRLRIAARRQMEMVVILREHLNEETAEWLDVRACFVCRLFVLYAYGKSKIYQYFRACVSVLPWDLCVLLDVHLSSNKSFIHSSYSCRLRLPSQFHLNSILHSSTILFLLVCTHKQKPLSVVFHSNVIIISFL